MKITLCPAQDTQEEIIIKCIDQNATHIQKMLQAIYVAQKKIPVIHKGETLFFSPSAVLYVESVEEKSYVCTLENTYPIKSTLTHFVEEFKHNGFFRCSKSMAVNLMKIQSLKSEMGGRILITLTNQEKLLVSRKYASLLRTQLSQGGNHERI